MAGLGDWGSIAFFLGREKRVQNHCQLLPISVDTFMKMMRLLTEKVKQKISDLLSELFALVFDGWTLGQTRYLAVFATFPDVKSESGYMKVLLAFSPMEEEESLNANAHVKFFEYVLQLYGKSWNNVAALIGDNCTTDLSFAGKANTYFIGCASHRFNLAMKFYFEEHKGMLKKINDIMSRLKNLIPAAKLRAHTHLKAKTRNLTRWSSTFEMVLCYTKMFDVLPLLEINEIDDMLLSIRENRDIDSMIKELKDIESVSKALQMDTVTMASVRVFV
jgi:hypothetical protein